MVRVDKKNYRKRMHYNRIAVIFCRTPSILYHNGIRLQLINQALFFNLRFSKEYQKFKFDSAR